MNRLLLGAPFDLIDATSASPAFTWCLYEVLLSFHGFTVCSWLWLRRVWLGIPGFVSISITLIGLCAALVGFDSVRRRFSWLFGIWLGFSSVSWTFPCSQSCFVSSPSGAYPLRFIFCFRWKIVVEILCGLRSRTVAPRWPPIESWIEQKKNSKTDWFMGCWAKKRKCGSARYSRPAMVTKQNARTRWKHEKNE